MSLPKLQFEGECEGNCLYGGLAIYQDQKEIIQFCTNRTLWTDEALTTTKSQQSFVSSSNSISVVLYSIRYYTSVRVVLNITATTCTGIIINPCEFEAYCSLWIQGDLTLCETYLQSFSSSQVQVYKENIHVMLSMNLQFLKQTKTKWISEGVCTQIHLSSAVQARFKNASNMDFNNNMRDTDCIVNIKIKGDELFTHSYLHSHYLGSISLSEYLEILGHGYISSNNGWLEDNKGSSAVKIQECKHKVKVNGNENINLESTNKIGSDDVSIFTLDVKGSSISTVLVTFKLYSFTSKMTPYPLLMNSYDYSGSGHFPLSVLTCETLLSNYQVPIMINNNYRTTQMIHSSLTVLYAERLDIALWSRDFLPDDFKYTVLQFRLRSAFCFFTCVRIANIKFCGVLDEFDPYNSKAAEVHLHKCGGVRNSKDTLYWSKTVSLNHFKHKDLVASFLLPGVYHGVTLSISHLAINLTKSKQFPYLDIQWQDMYVQEKVGFSLQFNGKQYLINEPSSPDIVFSWEEAENTCVDQDGHLPSISSQSDAQDLVTVILRAVWTGPIRLIYLGLKVGIILLFSSIMFLVELQIPTKSLITIIIC